MNWMKCNRPWPFGGHNFGRWELVEEGDILYPSRYDPSKTIVKGRWLDQKRTCIDCHFVEINTQRSSI